MGKWKYRKEEPAHIRGLCCRCKINQQKKKTNGNYQPLCRSCERVLYQSEEARKKKIETTKRWKQLNGPVSYRRHKVSICNHCNFTSEYPCQFDVDHIDGNHKNNDVSNLQTLCANCHRLKTLLNKEGIYRDR
jgi:hypothetical protein